MNASKLFHSINNISTAYGTLLKKYPSQSVGACALGLSVGIGPLGRVTDLFPVGSTETLIGNLIDCLCFIYIDDYALDSTCGYPLQSGMREDVF